MIPEILFHRRYITKKSVFPSNLDVLSYTASAMGIYEAEINDRKIGNHYFTPGYTHYQTYLQFQSYDVTEFIKQGKNEIDITVANGWFLCTIGNKNNNYGKYRGFIGELHLWFADGSYEVIGTIRGGNVPWMDLSAMLIFIMVKPLTIEKEKCSGCP